MSTPPADYLTETLPEDERLQNVMSLNTGLNNALCFLHNRLARYHDLLELEIEDLPGADLYLKEAADSLKLAASFLASFDTATQSATTDFESFDLALMAKGMASRIEKLGGASLTLDTEGLDGDDAFITGRLFLLQQALLALPRILQADSQKMQLRISLEKVDDSFFLNRKSPLSGGEYYALSLVTGEDSWEQNKLASLNERLVTMGETPALEHLLFVGGVISNHGGEIFTNKGKGPLDSIVIFLPAARNTVAMYTEPGTTDEELRGTETILLVDDEAIIWDVVIDMLQGMGYTVILAGDGRECVEIYAENPGEIDVVLLDMVMPEMNGKQAYFALKEIDPAVVVLLQSGYINEEDARDVLDAGAKGFLRKPYKMRELARKIREVIESTR